jgi:hypothetical protein
LIVSDVSLIFAYNCLHDIKYLMRLCASKVHLHGLAIALILLNLTGTHIRTAISEQIIKFVQENFTGTKDQLLKEDASFLVNLYWPRNEVVGTY